VSHTGQLSKPMNPFITIVAKQVIDLYDRQLAALAGLPRQQLEDLLYDSEHVFREKRTFSIRTAAQINIAAATIALEQRGAAPQTFNIQHSTSNKP
jgi:hypothetical protein